MLNLKSAFLSALRAALLIAAAGVGSGCGGVASTVHSDWEEELRSGYGLSCHDIRHIGYGIHYDIVLNGRQTVTREGSGAYTREGRHKPQYE